MQGHPYLRFVWPVSVIGVILVAALWPHNAHSLLVALPQRMVWASLLVLLVAIPIGSLVFPRGRAAYVFVTSVVILVVALGLAVAFNGGLSSGLAGNSSRHYRWLAVWELLSLLLTWVSISALTRYLTHERELAVRLLAVGGLYLVATMVLGACFAPLEKLLLLTFSYGTSLFGYAIGNSHGLVFARATYHVTLGVSLGTTAAVWCVMGILMWTSGRANRPNITHQPQPRQ